MKAIVPGTVDPGGRDAPPEFRRIARAIEFVAANARQQPSLADMAAAANWSEYHFAREFRRWTGISPKQWLQQLSLTAAKQALDDERSVLQAAIDAGLSGPGRLHDLFVTLEAVTPGEYKSRGRGLTMWFGTAQSPFGEALIVRSAPRHRVSRVCRREWRVRWLRRFPRDLARCGLGSKTTRGRSRSRTRSGGCPGAPTAGSRSGCMAATSSCRCGARCSRPARNRTLSYAALAESIGRGSACRAVGSAVGANPVAWLIPCHHVLRANGALGGYRWGLERKRAMLAWELARSVRNASRRRPSTSLASAGSR